MRQYRKRFQDGGRSAETLGRDRQCTDIKELTPAIVNKLIRRIEVHNSEKVDGRKQVRLDVYFTAVGLIDIPGEKELIEMMQEIQSVKSA